MKRIIIIIGLLFCNLITAQKLADFIQMALENSPEIQSFELKYRVATEKTNEVNTIPNTEFGLGYFVSEPETRTGAQKFKISAKQMIPWFGNISARENYVNSLADAKYEDILISKRKLITSVSQSYYNLYANKAKQLVLIESIELIEVFNKLALNSVEAGNASVVDVLRLEMRKNELKEIHSILEYQYKGEQTKMNNLLNRDKNSAIEINDLLELPTNDSEINTENLLLHPELLKYEKLYHSISQSELLNKKQNTPMLGVGLDYINVEKRPGMEFDDNGKDIFMPMISFSIPIFNKQYKSKTKQNDLLQLDLVQQKQLRKNNLETLLENAINARFSARVSFETQNKNLEQALQAEQILLTTYETSSIDFDDVLDIQELQLKYELNKIQSITNYYIQSTIINYITK